ncbi:argonaute-like protein [Crucibulum laeve]|uniref:Argonaute-like protein n=1 Tax=Crucibulum laeve TaxID=68775 RepID=A0A5C3M1Y6_9AGAR|nr:argonaute-like protein [Crucibulum laeve]
MADFRPTTIITNSFEITVPNTQYQQYDVAFQPEVKAPRRRWELISKLQTAIAPEVFNPRIIYDGNVILYSRQPLKLSGGNKGSFTMDAPRRSSTTGKDRGLTITLTHTASEVIHSKAVEDLIFKKRMTNEAAVAINLLQLIVRQEQQFTATSVTVRNGKAYYPFPSSKDRRPFKNLAGLEMWLGYHHSVRPGIGKMIITLDTSVATMYTSGNLLEHAMGFLKLRNIRDLSSREKTPHFRELERHLSKVLINIDTMGKKTKSIRGLILNAGQFRFTKGDEEKTVERHYMEAHNTRLKYPDAFGVRLSPDGAPPVVVPAELCHIIPGQLYRKRLPDSSKADMVAFSTSSPDARLRKIQQEVGKYQSSQYLREAGIAVKPEPMKINAKILNVPNLQFANGNVTPREGKWNLLNQKLVEPKNVLWSIVDFTNTALDGLTSVLRELHDCSNALGVRMDIPLTVHQGNAYRVIKELELALTQSINEFPVKSQAFRNFTVAPGKPLLDYRNNFVMVVILPPEAEAIRNTVKYWGDIQMGINTQCMRQDKLCPVRPPRSGNSQYYNNNVIKINVHVGGTNCHASGSSIMREIGDRPFMIIGADVSHPGPGSQKPSIASLVFSLDRHATRYAARMSVQHPRLELIDDLQAMMKDAVNTFGSINRVAPQRIFFYRDGVSEGEFSKIREIEIPAVQAAIQAAWQENKARDPLPKVTFIVVGKRHKTVLFPLPQQGDNKGNCFPGTTVDNDIVHPAECNFYLQSHAAIQGTSRSAHYTVLRDDNLQFQTNKLEALSFALCHVYSKATRSVSIPAPVYYADAACDRGKFHFDPDGRDLRFDDSSSVRSGEAPAFDIQPWRNTFKHVNLQLRNSMYFI